MDGLRTSGDEIMMVSWACTVWHPARGLTSRKGDSYGFPTRNPIVLYGNIQKTIREGMRMWKILECTRSNAKPRLRASITSIYMYIRDALYQSQARCPNIQSKNHSRCGRNHPHDFQQQFEIIKTHLQDALTKTHFCWLGGVCCRR